MVNRRGFFAIAAAGAATALSACSTGSSSDSSSSSSGAGASSSGASSSGSAAGFPVEIKHALGTTKIEKAPSKVAVIGWSDADVCAALGVVPVAMLAVTYGGNAAKSTDWFDAKVKELGGKTPTLLDSAAKDFKTKLAALGPDLILATNSGVTKEQYAEYSKIAPVVAYPNQPYGTSWQESTTLVAQALGKVDDGKKLVTDTEKMVTDAVAKYPELKDKSVSWVYFTATNMNSVGLYTPIDNRPKLLKEMGFSMSKGVEALTKGSTAFFVDVSAEKAAQVDSNVIVFDEGMGVTEEKVKSSALFAKIPALKNNAAAVLNDNKVSFALSAPTPLSLKFGLDGLLPKLAAAAKNAK